MRALTTVLIAGAVVLIVVVGLLVRSEQIDKPPARVHEDRPEAVARAEKNAAGQRMRSARVEQRLQRLRENSESRARREPRLDAPPRRLEPRPEARAMLPTPRTGAAELTEDDDEDTEELAETIRSNPDPEERASALFFLSGGELRTVLPIILEALDDPDAEVRLAAVEALDEYADDIDPEVLTPALNDPSPEVRFEALGIVGDMDDSEHVRDVARRMLNDPDEEVRSLAEGILDMEGG
jgi:hypothetical protein